MRTTAELTIARLDGSDRRIMKFADLRAKVDGALGAGRIFWMDDELWRIERKDYPFTCGTLKARMPRGKAPERKLSDERP